MARSKWIMNRVVVQLDEGGLCYISMMDVTASMVQRKSWEEESRNLRELAKRDSFTKLLNRGTMEHLIEKTLQKDNGSQEYAYISLDVDNFKRINDVYGHGVGDMLLLELAGLLQETFGSRNNYIGRMGGDEFAVFAKNYKDREEVYEKAYHVLDEIHQKRDCIGLREAPSVSIGIAFAPDAGNEFQDLYERLIRHCIMSRMTTRMDLQSIRRYRRQSSSNFLLLQTSGKYSIIMVLYD